MCIHRFSRAQAVTGKTVKTCSTVILYNTVQYIVAAYVMAGKTDEV
jgi:hypothetical protein